jgi:signal transduction histidine kinase/pSer/pThr/pTyr-binding forkhead associated (FHA) protein
MLVLTITQGPDKGRKFELPDDEPQLIGRSSEALPITDNTVSRRHAELTPDDGAWWLRDLKSQNGTYVNGLRITQRTRLKPGDQIRTGSTLFMFGQEASDPDLDMVHLLDPYQIDSEVEQTLASNEDSVLMAEPEPGRAAVDHLRVIYRLTTLTSRVLDRQQLLKSVMELIFEVFEPERGFIMLCGSPEEEDFRPAVVKYGSEPMDTDAAQIHVSKTILQHAIDKGEGVLSSNAMSDPRFAAGDSVQRYHIRSAICSPIRSRGRTYGAIYIDSSIANYSFTAEQLALMNAIGQHAGLALANAELYTRKLQTERLAAIGETVASLSHSIKNILQGLRGGADVVDMGLKKEDLKLARGGWDILKRNLDRIISLTLNMLAFSRQRQVDPELTKIGPLIADCAQLLENQCQAREVALMVDVDTEMPPIPLDAGLIHQALMNLMSNAVDAVEPGRGAVTVRAVYHEAEARGPGSPAVVEIEVIDNGPGITKDRLGWIFEPFNTTKGMRGTGLGLAVTKRIIEEHRGRIAVQSEPGAGATFRVILPADSQNRIDPAATAGTKISFDAPAPF